MGVEIDLVVGPLAPRSGDGQGQGGRQAHVFMGKMNRRPTRIKGLDDIEIRHGDAEVLFIVPNLVVVRVNSELAPEGVFEIPGPFGQHVGDVDQDDVHFQFLVRLKGGRTGSSCRKPGERRGGPGCPGICRQSRRRRNRPGRSIEPGRSSRSATQPVRSDRTGGRKGRFWSKTRLNVSEGINPASTESRCLRTCVKLHG